VKRVWRVKKRKYVRDTRGIVVASPGDLLPEDDENALRCLSSVELIADPYEACETVTPVDEPEDEPEPDTFGSLDEF